MTRLPDADWRSRPGMAELVAALGANEARFVGGAVRDTLLGLPVSDVDMATVLAPDAVIARLEAAGIKAVPTGLAHGTVTAVSKGVPVEVTTLRRDISTDGRRATVAFTDDWRADAARRDFTINALYADPATGTIFDWFGGLDDLVTGRVAFIGAPLERIAEDHLRILRFFRFHARFGKGAPDAAALAACALRANDLMALSRERIASEMLKLLETPDPLPTLTLMLDHAILVPVLPELRDTATMAGLLTREGEAGFGADPIRRLAALIGPDPATAEAIAARLRLSKAQARRLTLACGWEESVGRANALAYWIGREAAIDRLLIRGGDLASVKALADWQPPAFPIGGGVLIARGLPPGPHVARTLRVIERAWADAGFPEGNDFEAIVSRALLASTT